MRYTTPEVANLRKFMVHVYRSMRLAGGSGLVLSLVTKWVSRAMAGVTPTKYAGALEEHRNSHYHQSTFEKHFTLSSTRNP